MNSEQQPVQPTVEIDRNDQGDTIPTENVSSTHQTSQKSAEIGQGDVVLSPEEPKDEVLSPDLENKDVKVASNDETSEDLELRWDDEDEDIEGDIISINPPGDMFYSLPESSSAIVDDVENISHTKPDDNSMTAVDTDKDVIDITDLSSPMPLDEEPQESFSPHAIEDTDKADDKDDESAKDIEKAKELDDDLIIIEDDDNDDVKEVETEIKPDTVEKDEKKFDIINTSHDSKESMNVSDSKANEHGLNKPDIMLEIPTQEIIDCLDDTDISVVNESQDNESEIVEVTKDIDSVEEVTETDIETTNKEDIMVIDDVQDSETVKTKTDIENTNKETMLIEDSQNVSKTEQFDVEMNVDSSYPIKQTLDRAESETFTEKIDIVDTEMIEPSQTDLNTNTDKPNSIDINIIEESKTDANTVDKPSSMSDDVDIVEENEFLPLKNDSLLKEDTEIKVLTDQAESLTFTEAIDTNTQCLETKSLTMTELPTDDNSKALESQIELSQSILVSSESTVINEKTDSARDTNPIQNSKTNAEIDTVKPNESPIVTMSETILIDKTTDTINKEQVKESTISVENTASNDKESPKEPLETPQTEKQETKVVSLERTKTEELTSESKSEIAKEVSAIEQPCKEKSSKELPTSDKPGNDSTASSKSKNEPISEQLAPDSKDEAPEVTDSLGLLAESSRVVEDDEEQDEEDDDDDEFDQDESSNQMTAEHSEDSNAQNSESDAKDQEEKGVDTPQEEKGPEEFTFAISNIASGQEAKDVEADIDGADVGKDVELAPEQMDVDKAVGKVPEEKQKEKDEQDKPANPDEAMEVQTVKLSDASASKTESSILKKILVEPKQVKKDEDVSEVGAEVTICSDGEAAPTEEETIPVKTTRINTSEVMIKTIPVTVTSAASAIMIQELKPSEDKPKPKFSLEVFNLDSDEEDTMSATETIEPTQQEAVPEPNKCVNMECTSGGKLPYYRVDAAALAVFDVKNKKGLVCEECAQIVAKRAESLIDGIKNLTPLLELGIVKDTSECVEISDSDSETEEEPAAENKETIGEEGAALVEQQLAKLINETWLKFKMDSRLSEAEDSLTKEMKKLEEESKEIGNLLNECQVATDKLRNELYATFECERHELAALTIFDTPLNKYSCLESMEMASGKRRLSSASESPSKKPAIPLGYTPLDSETKDAPAPVAQGGGIDATPAPTQLPPSQPEPPKPSSPVTSPSSKSDKLDDDKDIAVLKVSAESAPSDLPPPGDLVKPPLKPGMVVFAMRNMFRSWMKSKIVECMGKSVLPGSSHSFTMCRVKIESEKVRGPVKVLPGRCLAYSEPSTTRMTIGTRVIALFKDTEANGPRRTFYSGIVAEVPNPVNNYRYLVFFDDGYAQYVRHADTRLVCECAPLVWAEVHPLSREFVREYLLAYPERPMVRLHAGQSLKTEWNGKWWPSRVVQVDASLVKVHFEEDNRTEWIYRGSTRLAPLYLELQAAERHRARPMPRTRQARINMPYVEYTRSEEQSKEPTSPAAPTPAEQRESRQRAVAKKSTAAPQPPPPATIADNVISRVVYYTPKNAVKPFKMTPHTCTPACRRKDVLALADLRTYNPLAKPLLSGWERQIVRYKGQKEVMYRAPCGRRVRSMAELHRYLRVVQSDMAVDLFDFGPNTHCLAEFVLNTCRVGKKDLSHGKESVPVPCVNYYDDSLPEFCSYNTERTPTAGVPLNLDPEFLCGCDCTDDCVDKSKCACWRMTLEGARTIGLKGPKVGYLYKRLPEPLPSGIYECNSRCKCKHTCLNRVAQHPLQLKLQVFKTQNRGWGIRALNDVPKGSFLCVYAGNLLTDATANMDGLNEGDEYLAELDYIEVVEQMKEGYEDDIPEADKRLDKKNQVQADEEETEEESPTSEDENIDARTEKEDDDFRPGHIGAGVAAFNKRLRKRNKKKEKEDAAKEDKKEKEQEKQKEQKGEDDCITISDDEEAREPSRFAAQAGMQSNEFVSKYRSVRSYFGKDEACYIMDAKVQGNIGRYLNHSCTPNVFVQNVFVDTHDPRFPWVAFFALCHIRAGTELTWNYNYDVGSVPGKVLYCYCGAANCRGRLL